MHAWSRSQCLLRTLQPWMAWLIMFFLHLHSNDSQPLLKETREIKVIIARVCNNFPQTTFNIYSSKEIRKITYFIYITVTFFP